MNKNVNKNIGKSGIISKNAIAKNDGGQGKDNLRIAVVAHVYYLEMAPEILIYLSHIPVKYRLYITVSANKSEELIKLLKDKKLDDYEIIICPNQGYDIAPFLHVLHLIKDKNFDLVCKIHTKKGPVNQDDLFRDWFEQLMSPILGSKSIVRNILKGFIKNKDLGMVGSADFYKSAQGLMYGNEAHVEKLLSVIDVDIDPSKEWGFFAGTIFWARVSIFSSLLNNPNLEKLVNKGIHLKMEAGAPVSVFHALERVFGLLPGIMKMKTGISHQLGRIRGAPSFQLLSDNLKPSSKSIYGTLVCEKKKPCIVVLGMHRSGTSVLSGLTSFFSFSPGADLMAPTKDNPKGYFENNKVVRLNDKIFEDQLSSWRDYTFNVDEIDVVKWREYVEKAKQIILEEADESLSLLKDPRLCLLFPIWEQALEELNIPLKIIIVYRNPSEIACSLYKRNNSDNLDYEHSYLLWAHSIFQLELHSRKYPRLFINYAKDFQDIKNLLNRLGSFTGQKVTEKIKRDAEEFYAPSLNHHHDKSFKEQINIPLSLAYLEDELRKNGVSETREIDELRHDFYSSEQYLGLYKKAHSTKIKTLVDVNSKNIKEKQKLKGALSAADADKEKLKNELEQIRIFLEKKIKDNSKLLIELEKNKATFDQYKKDMLIEIEHKNARIAKAEKSNTISKKIVARLVNDAVFAKKIKNNLYGYPNYELKNLYKLIKNDKSDKKLQKEKTIIAESGIFSPVYYLTNNPDIWELGDPLESYCKSGWKDARRPGPDFDPVFYWMMHPEVPRTTNPLVHYILEGRDKGLAPYGISYFLEKEIPAENLINSGFSCRGFHEYVDVHIPHVDFTDDVLVSIIIINRNGVHYLQTLLPMLFENTQGIHYEVIVVDNNSDDHSIFYLENIHLDIPLTIIKNEKNESFSVANNQAATKAKGRFLVLLNNDVEPMNGWLNYLLQAYNSNENTGSVGARLVYPFKHSFSKSCSIQHAGIAFRYEGDFYRPYNLGNGKPANDVSVLKSEPKSTLTAACLLVPKDIYLEVGGLDEQYLYGYEDVDFGLKLTQKGYANIYASDAVLFHHEFGTQDKDDPQEVIERRQGNLEVFRNKWYRFIKHAYWKEKLDGGEKLYAEKNLYIAFIVDGQNHHDNIQGAQANDYVAAQQLANELKGLSWRTTILAQHENEYLPEGIDLVVNLTESFNPVKIPQKHKRIVTIAWLYDGYESWQENELLTEYDAVLVSSKDDSIFKEENNASLEDGISVKKTNIRKISGRLTADILRSFLLHRYVKTSIAIKIPAPEWEGIKPWGDYHVAVMLKKSLENEGYRVILQVISEWYNDEAMECDVALVLRGLERYSPKSHQLNILWNISHPDLISLEEYEEYDVVCVASDYWAKELKEQISVPVEVVHQCTDIDRFFPPSAEEKHKFHQELLFVGNSRGVYRQILRDLLPTDHDLVVIGGGWKDLIPQEYWVSRYLENDELYKHYGAATILLNDHWNDMREKGFVSNRIYDGLASGAFIISDRVRDMGEIADYICVYDTKEELRQKVDYYITHPEERDGIILDGIEYIKKNHTYDIRASQFSKIIRKLVSIKN